MNNLVVSGIGLAFIAAILIISISCLKVSSDYDDQTDEELRQFMDERNKGENL